ncbi:MAG: glutamate racemase [Simkania sp.]|nr:glutamate racemase [Simkania sp.]
MPPDLSSSKIGIFDSGFGGLTVMRSVMSALPNEHIVYFGDTARLPYGEKSADAILRYTVENIEFLLEHQIKLLIIACNTVCAIALDQVKERFSIPIIGMIEPAISKIKEVTQGGPIAVLGTRGTVRSGMYQQKISSILPKYPVVAIACPLFVSLVEEGYFEHPLVDIVVQEYLRPLKNNPVDTVLLACTHYPLLKSAIAKELGDSTVLIDPALGCADQAKAFLQKHTLLNPSSDPPRYTFFVSDDPEKFRLLGKTFLNYPIEHVHLKS